MANKVKKVEEEAANGDFTTIGITFSARDKLKRFCDKRNGANVREVSSALVEWFVGQKPVFQTAILQSVDSGMEMYYATALRQLADALEKAAGSETADGKYSQYGETDLNVNNKTQNLLPAPVANESNADSKPRK